MYNRLFLFVFFLIAGWSRTGMATATDTSQETVQWEMLQQGFSPEQIRTAEAAMQRIPNTGPRSLPRIARLQILGLSPDHYYSRHTNLSLTEYYNARVNGGASARIAGGIGMTFVGILFCGGAVYKFTQPRSYFDLNPLWGMILAGLGGPLLIAGIVTTAVGSVRQGRSLEEGTVESAAPEALETYKKSEDGRRYMERRRQRQQATRVSITATGDRQTKGLGVRFLF